MKTGFLIALSIAWLAGGNFAVAEDDQVFMKRGAAVRGKIGQVSPPQIEISVNGANKRLNTNEIRLINFSDEPTELRQGRARAVAGKYDAALSDLKRVDAASITRPLVKRDLQFYLALCQGRLAIDSGAGKAQATEKMLAFVRADANSHHFFQAADLLGDLAVAQGDFDNAVKYYGAIASKAPWPDYRLSAEVSEADALVKQERFADAQKKYESIESQKADTPEVERLKLLAQVGRGRCLAETASADEGIAVIEQLILEHDATDTELFGRAYNALGDCLQTANKPKDALMAYLHVDVLFYGDSEIHAESLYHLSKLWLTAKTRIGRRQLRICCSNDMRVVSGLQNHKPGGGESGRFPCLHFAGQISVAIPSCRVSCLSSEMVVE